MGPSSNAEGGLRLVWQALKMGRAELSAAAPVYR